jgi:hypothetical protein
MTKYTLIAEHTSLFTGAPVSKSTHEFEADGLMDVVENVELFLKGAGFVFDGYLDIVPPEEDSPEWQTPEFQTPNGDTVTLSTGGAGSTVTVGGAGDFHSQYFFDTERNK